MSPWPLHLFDDLAVFRSSNHLQAAAAGSSPVLNDVRQGTEGSRKDVERGIGDGHGKRIATKRRPVCAPAVMPDCSTFRLP